MTDKKRWLEDLIREGKIAYERGERLVFDVVKRQDLTHWKLYRQRLIKQGTDIEVLD